MVQEVHTITIDDQRYPTKLKQVYKPPRQLYVRGNPDLLNHDQLLAVVGSRKASAYGKNAVTKLLVPVVRAGIPLVSGLAYGIDSMAHRLCLEQNQPTIAVLGSGLDDASLYPQRHRDLAHNISQAGGAVVTEYPAGTPAHLGRFPARNRIIAGLARATLVVQAAARSGSLITARLALEGGKEVLAVPGAITDPLAQGVNQLIQQGATPALTAQDILDLFGITPEAQLETIAQKLTFDQQAIVKVLSAEPQHIDELVQQTKLSSSSISATLIELEMAGAAQHVGGMKYVRT